MGMVRRQGRCSIRGSRGTGDNGQDLEPQPFCRENAFPTFACFLVPTRRSPAGAGQYPGPGYDDPNQRGIVGTLWKGWREDAELSREPVSDYTKPSDLIDGDWSGGYACLRPHPLTGLPRDRCLVEENVRGFTCLP